MIREAGWKDLDVLVRLARQLWSGADEAELRAEFEDTLSDADARFFLKYDGEEPVGFAQCQLRRDYVEGTHSSPVGYLEAIFVRAAHRKRGFGRELLGTCEQ